MDPSVSSDLIYSLSMNYVLHFRPVPPLHTSSSDTFLLCKNDISRKYRHLYTNIVLHSGNIKESRLFLMCFSCWCSGLATVDDNLEMSAACTSLNKLIITWNNKMKHTLWNWNKTNVRKVRYSMKNQLSRRVVRGSEET